MSAVGWRRCAARFAWAVALAHVAWIATIAGNQVVQRAEVFRHYRRETFDDARVRLFGAAFVESVRSVRAVVPESETVYLIDEEPVPNGAAYFALHALAPRRVILLGAPLRESSKLVQSRLPRGARWVVIARQVGAPLELVSADALRPRRHRGGA